MSNTWQSLQKRKEELRTQKALLGQKLRHESQTIGKEVKTIASIATGVTSLVLLYGTLSGRSLSLFAIAKKSYPKKPVKNFTRLLKLIKLFKLFMQYAPPAWKIAQQFYKLRKERKSSTSSPA